MKPPTIAFGSNCPFRFLLVDELGLTFTGLTLAAFQAQELQLIRAHGRKKHWKYCG